MTGRSSRMPRMIPIRFSSRLIGLTCLREVYHKVVWFNFNCKKAFAGFGVLKPCFSALAKA
jgi:hypothetical protein